LLAVPSAVGASAAVVKRVVVFFDEANAIREAGPACTAAGGVGLSWETSSVVGCDAGRRVWGKSAILPVAGCMDEGSEKDTDTEEEVTHPEKLCAVLIERSATRKIRVKDENEEFNRTLSTVVSGQWKQKCHREYNKNCFEENNCELRISSQMETPCATTKVEHFINKGFSSATLPQGLCKQGYS
jgi:hypothetical protein